MDQPTERAEEEQRGAGQVDHLPGAPGAHQRRVEVALVIAHQQHAARSGHILVAAVPRAKHHRHENAHHVLGELIPQSLR